MYPSLEDLRFTLGFISLTIPPIKINSIQFFVLEPKYKEIIEYGKKIYKNRKPLSKKVDENNFQELCLNEISSINEGWDLIIKPYIVEEKIVFQKRNDLAKNYIKIQSEIKEILDKENGRVSIKKDEIDDQVKILRKKINASKNPDEILEAKNKLYECCTTYKIHHENQIDTDYLESLINTRQCIYDNLQKTEKLTNDKYAFNFHRLNGLITGFLREELTTDEYDAITKELRQKYDS